MENILTFKNVGYHYIDGTQKVTILDKANYNFEKGKIYAVVGPSGSGKTTTIALAGGLDNAKEGAVLYDGKDISKIGNNEYRRKYVSIVFQSYNLIHYMNAYENVMNALTISKIKKTDNKQYVIDTLMSLGLSHDQCFRDIRKLSGGQQQRIAIARAIAKDVDIILADEPTGNLDKKNALAIIKTLHQLAREKNKCVILVTHSMSIAKSCDVQLQIEEGQIIEI